MNWAQRMHRRAADLGSVVTSCGHPGPGPYPHRLEKVKFGVPLDEVCKNDIPGPLLVLILKLNKEAPQRKDVFRAPGHQGAMKKLIHFLQQGRLVNVDNYSVYTIASVLKKFLRKIPNGIFGREGEAELFAVVDLNDENEQQARIHRLITSLPVYTQRLLVLLFGTFRVIASNAVRAETGMTSEALGVSVAPSFFQSCVSDGKTARMEDVLRFKVATKIMKQMIDQFATYDLFGRDNYEYYARVTGRVLKVQDEWICSFRYPPPPRGKSAQQNYAVQLSLEAEKTWLQCECERWGLIAQEESQSTPALLTSSSSAIGNSALSLGIIPEHSLLESCARLSVSLEGPGVFAISSASSRTRGGNGSINLNGNSRNGNNGGRSDHDDDGDDENDNNHNNYDGEGDGEHQIEQQKYDDNVKNRRLVENNGGSGDNDREMSNSNRKDRKHGAIGKNNGKGSGNLTEITGTATGIGGGGGTSNNGGIKHSSSCTSTRSSHSSHHHMTMDELRAVNRYAESTKSLSYLPQVRDYYVTDGEDSVHERQTARMRTRSEWFLGGRGGSLEIPGCENCLHLQYHHCPHHQYFGGSTNDIQDTPSSIESANAMFLMFHQHQLQQQQQQQLQQHQQQQQPFHYQHHMCLHHQNMDTDISSTPIEHEMSSIQGISTSNNRNIGEMAPTIMLMDTNFPSISVGNIGLSASAESVHHSVKRSSRRGPNLIRHHPHRSSSRRNKENGNKSNVNTTNGCTAGSSNNCSNGGGSGGGGGVVVTTGNGCNNIIIPSAITSNGGSTTTTTPQGPIINLLSNSGAIGNTTVQQQQQQQPQLQHQSNRSNSFRQKKTSSNNIMTDCTSITCSNSKMRKPRAVSFESTNPQSSVTLSMTKISTSAGAVAMPYHHHHHRHNASISAMDDCNLMDTTPPPSDNDITTIMLPSSQSQPTMPPNVIHDPPQDTLTSSSTSHLHFKPPRV